MPTLQSSLRFALLENRDALGSLGLAPWVGMAIWMALAVLQEPLLLRQHGIFLSHEAAFVAWAAVFLQLLLTKDRQQSSPRPAKRLQANLVLLVAMGIGLALMLFAVDSLRLRTLNSVGIIWRASVLVLAWLPVAVAVSVRHPSRFAKVVLGLVLGWSMVLSAHLFQGGPSLTALAAVALSLACPLLMASPAPHP